MYVLLMMVGLLLSPYGNRNDADVLAVIISDFFLLKLDSGSPEMEKQMKV